MEPDDCKLRELILYLALRSEGDETFSKTKLLKQLFYSDFAAYARSRGSITGQTYSKLPYGPVPRRAMEVLNELEREGALALARREYHGYVQHKPVALREPDLSGFTGEEIATVDRALSQLWGHSARDVSDLSHEFLGWKIARDGEIIPYETALIDNSPPTEEETAFAEKLVQAGR